jgi:hypothetical protein
MTRIGDVGETDSSFRMGEMIDKFRYFVSTRIDSAEGSVNTSFDLLSNVIKTYPASLAGTPVTSVWGINISAVIPAKADRRILQNRQKSLVHPSGKATPGEDPSRSVLIFANDGTTMSFSNSSANAISGSDGTCQSI